MSALSDAGKRCLALVRKFRDMDDTKLNQLCVEDLREGFKYLQGHLIQEIVDYYIQNRRKF
jgi:hypothetical protein